MLEACLVNIVSSEFQVFVLSVAFDTKQQQVLQIVQARHGCTVWYLFSDCLLEC